MNFLAHLFLAGNQTGFIVGNILEDYTTGGLENSKNKNIPAEVKLGITQHRFIDSITDSHSNVGNCKQKLYPILGKYAGVATDVIFDHFLLKNWNKFTDENFKTFRIRVYNELEQHADYQPPEMLRFCKSMRDLDWLKHYEYMWGLDKSFYYLNKRLPHKHIDLRLSLNTVEENYDFFDENFLVFFTDLKLFCDNFISENS